MSITFKSWYINIYRWYLFEEHSNYKYFKSTGNTYVQTWQCSFISFGHVSFVTERFSQNIILFYWFCLIDSNDSKKNFFGKFTCKMKNCVFFPCDYRTKLLKTSLIMTVRVWTVHSWKRNYKSTNIHPCKVNFTGDWLNVLNINNFNEWKSCVQKLSKAVRVLKLSLNILKV